MMNVMESFLESEINTQELYEDITRFIMSFHIRNGEFEGNRFIIKKMDQLNFFIFPEDEDRDGCREISYSMSVYRHVLLNEINQYAITKGIQIIVDNKNLY